MYLLFNRILKKIFNKFISLKHKYWKYNFFKNKNNIYPPPLKKQNAFNFSK